MYEKKIFRSNLKKVDYKEFNLSNKNQKFISKLIERKKICTYIPLDSELDINLFLNTFLEIQTTFLDDNELKVCILQEPFVINKLKIMEPQNIEIANTTQVFLYQDWHFQNLEFDSVGERDFMINF